MYHMLRDRGIDVPLFTCNTPCAEDNDDPVMRDINNGWDVAWCRWDDGRVESGQEHAPRARSGVQHACAGGRHSRRRRSVVRLCELAEDGQLDAAAPGVARLRRDGQDGLDGRRRAEQLLHALRRHEFRVHRGQLHVDLLLEPCARAVPPAGTRRTVGNLLHGEIVRAVDALFGPELVRARTCPEGTITVKGDSKKPPRVLQRVRGDKAFLFLRDAQDCAATTAILVFRSANRQARDRAETRNANPGGARDAGPGRQCAPVQAAHAILHLRDPRHTPLRRSHGDCAARTNRRDGRDSP